MLWRKMRRTRDAYRNEIIKSQGIIHDNLTRVVGTLAIQWAVMEMHLDRALELLHRNGGESAVQSDLPVSMRNKITYLRKSQALLDAKWHKQIGRLCDDLHGVRILRSDLLHGVASAYELERGGWEFSRSKFEKEQRQEIQTLYPLDDITAEILKVVKLAGRLSVFQSLLEAEFDPEYRRYLESQLPIS